MTTMLDKRPHCSVCGPVGLGHPCESWISPIAHNTVNVLRLNGKGAAKALAHNKSAKQ